MKVVAIIQARMGSSRLPGKILSDILGRPMLAHQLDRVKRAKVDEIVLATTRNSEDDQIVELAQNQGVTWFRGDEHDVLSRFVGAARQSRADVVIRLTGDCPLIDPGVIDLVIKELTASDAACDYAANLLERTYPRGLDVEALFLDVLERIGRMAKSRESREHVTLFCRSERPELFSMRSVTNSEDNADLRWTVDTQADLQLVRRIYQELDLSNTLLGYRDVVLHVRQHPELQHINSDEVTWDPTRKAA
ncbi:MAG: glycosyltransferase family protein [Planctomycetes bacterium]|nr:glycosyltransferase family protein [Planctomycetota bacterium]